MTRWPFHPPPHREEALTSWLNRLADANGVQLDEIIGSNFAAFTTGELDYRPPPLLVQDPHERTGVQPDVIRSMTLTGWVPWLFDTLEDPAPDAFNTYLQGSVILAPGQPRAHHASRGPATPADVEDRPSWAHIRELLEEAVAMAKLDREAARQLYGAATLGFPNLHDGARRHARPRHPPELHPRREPGGR